jgi:formamidopyrimidine-DNA glycosylase
MTGQLVVHPAGTPRANHTHLVFELDTGEELRFRDIRRFGSATLLHGQALAEFFERIKLGPEPFDIEARTWRESLGATARCLKAVLLDQQLVAGVGNIYADESLFEARLHPARAGRSLNAAEAQRLRRALSIVLKRAIARSGTTIRNYVGGSGMTGRYQDEFRVYGRAGQPCRRCQTPIERIRLAGRSTHYCRRCQPAGFRGQGSGVRYKDDPDLCLLTPDP